MRRLLPVYAVAAFAFLHLPLLVLAVFSFNSLAFHNLARIFASLVRGRAPGRAARGGGVEQPGDRRWRPPLISTVIGTLCAYALWKRRSAFISGELVYCRWSRRRS